jgi:type II secretory ATPase GspE/PulE/Tfp pilus assembly ATPase PilB-like protein
VLDYLINNMDQATETGLDKKLEEIRRRELKDKGIESKKTKLNQERKAEIKKTELGIITLKESKINTAETEIKNLADLKNKISKIQITEAIELIFEGAISIKASDIHLEPEEKNIRLRFRMDGVLQNVFDFEKKDYPTILNRLKLMAEMKINIHDAPQDGRITLKSKDVDIEVRVSVLPGAYGESIVMRLLDPRTLKKDLEELGMRPELLEQIKKQLAKTTGSILTTGPTGSGKTTTLYAFLNFVNKPGIKIITIEDPIEYHIKGISQTQVESEKGYTFANGLRSIVRQDPDIILVGEIRDVETTEIAMHAALTGHLVFSTLHTNDAAGTIPRLIDMGAKPQIIAPAINMAMAQRLVRKLCEKCKEKTEASAEEIERIKTALKNLEENKITIYKAKGCENCNLTGYQGRIGIFEAFSIDDEIEKIILKSPAIIEIKELIIKKGMITMLQDGYLKVIEGIIDMAEIERVLGK